MTVLSGAQDEQNKFPNSRLLLPLSKASFAFLLVFVKQTKRSPEEDQKESKFWKKLMTNC